jgi:RNA polymerase sigma-70 factor (ECF subfamily)
MRKPEAESIVLSYEPMIRRFFSGKVCGREDAEDLTQDAACAVISSLARFRGRSSLSTWIYAICRNILYAYYRTKTRQGQIPRTREEPLDPASSVPVEIRLIIEKLPARLKSVYRLFYQERRAVSEIAALLDRPAGTIKYLLYELRNTLRREIK